MSGQPVDNTTMVIKVAGQEYCVTNRAKRRHSKSHSLGSISDFQIEIERTRIDRQFKDNNNVSESTQTEPLNPPDETNLRDHEINKKRESSGNENRSIEVNGSGNQIQEINPIKTIEYDKVENQEKSGNKKRSLEAKPSRNNSRGRCSLERSFQGDFNANIEKKSCDKIESDEVRIKDDRGKCGDGYAHNHRNSVKKNLENDGKSEENGIKYGLSKSKSEGNPFQHKKKGKIIRVAQRPNAKGKFCVACWKCLPNVLLFPFTVF